MASILIIDDEEFIRESLSERVERLNHDAWTASNLQQGISVLEEKKIDLVFLDVNLPDGSGLEALSSIKQTVSAPEVIIITAAGSSQGAAIAIQNGAWDYITKPFSKEEISLHIQRSIDYRQAKEKQVIPMAIDTGSIIGQSRGLKKCISQIAQCAGSDANVLILGETGTGKELVAKAVHDNHLSITGNYIVVDCSALPETLAESVLFGHVKGAFTGADKASEGLIKQADQGTLFLDEIGELPLAMQKLFLRALQEKKFRPVGSSKEVNSRFRLISATNRNLDKMVTEGKFRQDLLHRMKTVSIKLPPLRERKEDIQVLTQHYIHRLCKEKSIKTKALLPETLEILEFYPWPGNIRELINVIERAIISEPELPILYPMFLPDRLRIHFADQKLTGPASPLPSNSHAGIPASILPSLYTAQPLPELKSFREAAVNEIENLYLKSLLLQTDWDLEKAADISGVSKSRLYYLIKKYNLKKI
jgi:two-component system NtrC family response regulator